MFQGHPDFKDADYVIGWFLKASEYSAAVAAKFAFVSTSSICQGEQVQFLWPRIWRYGQEIDFAYEPFQWANNAANNAGVWVVIVGVRPVSGHPKYTFDNSQRREVVNISPYLISGPSEFLRTAEAPISAGIPKMIMGNMARDDGNLILSRDEFREIVAEHPQSQHFIVPLYGTKEIADGLPRYALHLDLVDEAAWRAIPTIASRVEAVRRFRAGSKAKTTNGYAAVSHRFAQYCHRDEVAIALPSVTPEERLYVTPIMIPKGVMVTNLAYLIYGFRPDLLSILSSRMHTAWMKAVSGRLGSGVRYTPTISYHTFPVPSLTEKNKADLTNCAEDILLAREAHFPATIADLYDPEAMPDDLRRAHERNDETVERIYIGRTFRNDTERLEKLFELYTKMTAKGKAA